MRETKLIYLKLSCHCEIDTCLLQYNWWKGTGSFADSKVQKSSSNKNENKSLGILGLSQFQRPEQIQASFFDWTLTIKSSLLRPSRKKLGFGRHVGTEGTIRHFSDSLGQLSRWKRSEHRQWNSIQKVFIKYEHVVSTPTEKIQLVLLRKSLFESPENFFSRDFSGPSWLWRFRRKEWVKLFSF